MKVGLNPVVSLLFHIAGALVFETEEAVITEVGVIRPFKRTPRYEYEGVQTYSIDVDRTQLVTQEDPTCVTFDRQLGVCRAIRDCYRHTRVHQSLEDDETWVIGTRGSCSYTEPSGKQFNGICCHSKQTNQTDPSKNKLGSNAEGSRIISGESSYPGEFPFMVGIDMSGKFLCGGSLLDSEHVLTAAHCVNALSSQGVARLSVFMGVVDLNDPNQIKRRVRSIIRHRQFDGYKLHNDVAILKLSSPVEFSSRVSPVCLHRGTSSLDGYDSVAIGWGKMREGGSRSDTLQKVTLQIKSLQDCKDNFGGKAPGGIVDHFLCASSPGKDSCGGDSGGPLMVGNCQVGIVSWGIGCATETYGVYTRISSFTSWIDRNKNRY